MTQYNTLNLKLSNSQLNKLKLGIKNGTEVTLIFPPKSLLTNTQVLKFREVCVYHSSDNI